MGDDPVTFTDPTGLKLECKNVEGPKAGYCGAISWKIRWQLKPKSKSGGYVIQHLEAHISWADCEGKNPGSVSKEYWEAWYVNPGSKVTAFAEKGVPYDDEYAWTDKGKCTKGEMTFWGSVDFYEGMTPEKLTALGFKQPPLGGPSGILPITYNDPKLSPTDNLLHVMDAGWDCCPNTKRKTDVGCHLCGH